MKKVLIGVVAALLIVAAICFGVKSSINKEVSIKIDELNKNGFSITQNNSNLPMKIRKDGQIEIVDAIKAIDFVTTNISESQAKELFVELLNIFDSQSKQLALEGMKFDYDFSFMDENVKSTFLEWLEYKKDAHKFSYKTEIGRAHV